MFPNVQLRVMMCNDNIPKISDLLHCWIDFHNNI